MKFKDELSIPISRNRAAIDKKLELGIEKFRKAAICLNSDVDPIIVNHPLKSLQSRNLQVMERQHSQSETQLPGT